jgi:transcription-repair coupling factor (superfamily II helicase)
LKDIFKTLEIDESQKLINNFFNEVKSSLNIKGLVGSGLTFRLAWSYKLNPRNILFIAESLELAQFYLNDLETFIPKKNIYFFPSSFSSIKDFEDINNDNLLIRNEVLSKRKNNKKIIITYPDAVSEKIISEKIIENKTQKISKGDCLSIEFINEVLFEYEFERVDYVTKPGEFSVRGGIIDVFSFSNQHPYRIEFYDNIIDSLRTFNIENQLSIENFNTIDISPNVGKLFFKNYHSNSLIKSLSSDNICVIENIDALIDFIEKNHDNFKIKEKYGKTNNVFVSKNEIIGDIKTNSFISLSNSEFLKTSYNLKIQQSPQPSFNKKFDLIINYLKINSEKKIKNIICASTEEQGKRIENVFEQYKQNLNYDIVYSPIFQGFEDKQLKVAILTDHQIFDRYFKYRSRSKFKKNEALTIGEISDLKKGDFITHIDHGIGIFSGLQKINNDGIIQEVIKLFYADKDILYVSIHSLHKISKFKSKDDISPKLHKLGSRSWKILKDKTKKRLKEIAFDLISLYAKRRKKIGFSCNQDSSLQSELEASFFFEDTKDQIQATIAVKKDMESDIPMDRLICGDVGFGKTEIAIRAAFKAVDNGLQVVFLVPTTILAFQHFKNLEKRLKDFPLKIEYINRFRTQKDRTNIFKQTEEGKIDILIGTHQVVNRKINFKNLGLLIVDEEQKFGVSIKEKLRAFKTNVDVLALTATPIPRTLQFSLMSARDMSIISTPPPNRFPIQTEVIRFNENYIREAIEFEVQRGGQIYFIHNRIDNIHEVENKLQRLLPDIKIRVGHGRMDGKKFEKNLLDFMEGKYDLLLATTIVENGLDIPNANTIFIYNAQNFGLSDLHQMRGRVGRSNKKAFCYFITPPLSSISDDSRKRIKAIEEYSELGSGIKIAMKDLEIRGAGNLLGAEQSGFINNIGFETYQKILKEAISELSNKEFENLKIESNSLLENFNDTNIETDFSAMIPDYYVNVISERMNLYKRISFLKNESELKEFKSEIKDRFGKIPNEVNNLFELIQIKWIANKFCIEKLIIKKGVMIGVFNGDKSNSFFKKDIFSSILNWALSNPEKVNIKEKKTVSGLKLQIIFKKISSISKALDILNVINFSNS